MSISLHIFNYKMKQSIGKYLDDTSALVGGGVLLLHYFSQAISLSNLDIVLKHIIQ